ncbi:MAG: hypothetical protein ABR536_00625 [Solirubrobacterales bacterium]
MSELDDAIREHLELKRRHGARDAEVKQLEEEAFGTGERPADPFSAADQLLRGGEQGATDTSPEPNEEGTPTESLPEAPQPAASEQSPSEVEADAPTDQAPPPPETAPADGEPSPEPGPASSPIPPPPPPNADHPDSVVQMPTEEHPPPEPPPEKIDATRSEPASPGETPAFEPPPVEEPPAEEPPVEEPPADEPPAPAGSSPDAASGPALYDFESDSPPPPPEVSVEEDFAEFEDLNAGDDDAFADLGPADGAPAPGMADDVDDDADADSGPGAVTADTSEREAIDATEQYPVADQTDPPDSGSADLLEETPEFLEGDEGKDEDLWFEQRPPKDFDFE